MAQIKPLPAELQKIAIEELGEVPSRIPNDLQALKLWIQQQPHLKVYTDDQFLIQFLRGCKHSLERAKEKLDNFYTIRTKFSHLFHVTDVDEAKFRKFHNTACIVMLPLPLNDCGPRIVLAQLNYSSDEFQFTDYVRHCSAIVETIMMEDPFACICGGMLLLDGAKATAGHLVQLTPSIFKLILKYYDKALCIRIKKVCIINLPTQAEQILKIVLSYAPEKVKGRIIVCGKNGNSLDEHIPKQYLPREYGGENGSIDEISAEYHKVWDKYREYFKQNVHYGADEGLRLGKSLAFDDDLGTAGSFRQLEVD